MKHELFLSSVCELHHFTPDIKTDDSHDYTLNKGV